MKVQPTVSLIHKALKRNTTAKKEVLMGEKKVKGRKRHIVTDTLGHLLYVKVHAANTHDTKAGCSVVEECAKKHKSLKGISADEGYNGTTKEFVENQLALKVEISKKIKNEWAILAKRWIVERTFAWVNNFRRMSKDYEILTATAENFFRISMIQIMLDRVA